VTVYDSLLAHEMRLYVECSGAINTLCERVLQTLFYEPLTHTGTSASSEAVMKRRGGDVVSVTAERRSVQKGETLQDTIPTLACYGDAVVLPYPDVGGSQLGCEILAKVIEDTARDMLHVRTKGAFADEKKGMKAGNGHTVSYIGEMMPLSGLSQGKEDTV